MKDIERTLLDYALGVDSPQQRIAVEAELAKDSGLQMHLERIKHLLVEHAPREQLLPQGLRQKLVSAGSVTNRIRTFIPRLAELFGLNRETIAALLETVDGYPAMPWEDLQIAGVKALHFDGGPVTAGEECGFVYLEPGAEFPEHLHAGTELSFVLHGEMRESNGRVSLPGDVVRCEAKVSHSYAAQGTEPLIFAVRHNGIEIGGVPL